MSSSKRTAKTAEKKEGLTPDMFFAPLFWNQPKRLQSFVKYFNELSIEQLKDILTLISDTISNIDERDRKDDEMDRLCEQPNNIILADLIRLGYRVYGNTKTEDGMLAELQKIEIQAQDKIQLLLKVIKKHRTFFNRELYHHNTAFGFVSYPHYTDLKWRLDVVISNSHLKKVWQPQLSLSWELSDGRIIHMECTIEKFHELRFNVARALREMQVLDQRFNTQISESTKMKLKMFARLAKLSKVSRIAGLNKLKTAAATKQLKLGKQPAKTQPPTQTQT